MDALYLSTEAQDNTRLCIAPFTRQIIAATGSDAADAAGCLLFECHASGPENVQILARVASEDAALTLARLLNLG